MTHSIENPSEEDLASWHRTFGPRAFNETWGLLDLDELRDSIREDTALVSIMWANNESGVVQPWREALALCQDRQQPEVCGRLRQPAHSGAGRL